MTSINQTVTAVKLARPKQTAGHFQICIMTLHRWREQSGFPQPLKRGQVVLYDIGAITAWLAGEA
jgi:predicted DNA-binding transcriptional regulator AlpA